MFFRVLLNFFNKIKQIAFSAFLGSLLIAYVGSGSNPSGGIPSGAGVGLDVVGGQAAAPEQDSGEMAPSVDRPQCFIGFDGTVKKETLSSGRVKLMLQGYFRIPKSFQELPTPTEENTVITKNCGDAFDAESDRTFRIVDLEENTYIDIPLSDYSENQSTPEFRTGYIDFEGEFPFPLKVSGKLSGVDFQPQETLSTLPCPPESENCTTGEGWMALSPLFWMAGIGGVQAPGLQYFPAGNYPMKVDDNSETLQKIQKSDVKVFHIEDDSDD